MVLGIYLHDHETSNAGDGGHTEAVKLGTRASTGAGGASRRGRGRRRGAGAGGCGTAAAARGRGRRAAVAATSDGVADLLRDGLGS